ncbi:50S ribosomal protein L18 [Acidianus sulfidivorans JP7]|uniref:Large ribosomal subunit protein uL18 n=1 Tax=Acidianus sulfidivorans JP7 TaxID=619593 RepID=A0A2U9IQK5_9CREN|nr:50S ribosomal protein L18 [Acidianus sulfidivorans]AWR98273.1 50S ribosomal protein L18 [Acidianus sulfidivorans JP7]
MAYGPNYKVQFRRRREGKTNYYKRYTYVKSKTDRLVVRLTNNYVIASIVRFNPKGDETLAMAHSIELSKKFGWKGDSNNTPAAYLTGFLLGIRAKKLNIEKITADIGLFSPTSGARVFYTIKGVIDAGVKIPMGEIEIDNNRIYGKHIAEYAAKLEQENLDKFNRQFSKYLARGLNPKDLPSHVEEILNKIKSSGG